MNVEKPLPPRDEQIGVLVTKIVKRQSALLKTLEALPDGCNFIVTKLYNRTFQCFHSLRMSFERSPYQNLTAGQ